MGLGVQAVINAHLAWRERLEDCILTQVATYPLGQKK